MVTKNNALSLDSSRIPENPYGLHFERVWEPERSIPAPQFQYSVSYFQNPNISLLRSSWTGIHFSPETKATLESVEASESFVENPPKLEASNKVDGTDVLAWILTAASLGAGIYLSHKGYEKGDSNFLGVGAGLMTAGATWASAEILNRSLTGGERPGGRGSLLAISLTGGCLMGVFAKYTAPPALLLPSQFSRGILLDGKNPVRSYGP